MSVSSTRLHATTIQKTAILILAAVITSNRILIFNFMLRGQEFMELCVHAVICIHGAILKYRFALMYGGRIINRWQCYTVADFCDCLRKKELTETWPAPLCVVVVCIHRIQTTKSGQQNLTLLK
jgi:hypothetical protein